MLWFFCLCALIYLGLLTMYQSLCKALISFLFGSIFNWTPFFSCGEKGTVRFLISEGTNIGALCQESLKASRFFWVLLPDMFIVSYIKLTSRDAQELCFLMSYSCRKYFWFGFSLIENNLGMLPRMCEGSLTWLIFFLYLWKLFSLCHANVHGSWPRPLPNNLFTDCFGASLDNVMQSKCMEMHLYSSFPDS